LTFLTFLTFKQPFGWQYTLFLHTKHFTHQEPAELRLKFLAKYGINTGIHEVTKLIFT